MTGTPDSDANPSPTRSPVRTAFWFASSLAAVQFLALALTFWATSHSWFLTHDAYPMLASMGFAERSAGRDCQILLAGDSTALAGFNPAIFERKTGLKTCNIAEVRTVSDFFGTHYLIDRYLAQNRAPRFLVVGVAATNLNLEHEPWLDSGAEVFAYAMQYRRGPWLWHGMLLHPRDTLAFLTWAQSRILEDTLQRIRHTHQRTWTDERRRRDQAQGQWIAPLPRQTACVGLSPYLHTDYRRNQASVADFRRHYDTPQTTVLLFVTPIAECDRDVDRLRQVTDGLADNTLETEPFGDFNATDTHLIPPATDRFSNRIADRLLTVMAGRPSAASPAGLVE